MDNTEPQHKGREQEISQKVEALNYEIKKIAKWLDKVHFRRALFGVSQKDVWKKIGQLNDMYMTAVAAERARYDALLALQREQYEAMLAESRGQGEKR